MNIRLDIPEDFYKEEVRTGWTVTAHMKRVWAVQLDLLHELQRVCEKHHLTYFADSGTLLGAVRHQGYIPWDDDIDIVMKRADYDRLVKLGPAEFSHPYFLQNAHSEVFPRGYSRLRNSDSTALTEFDLGKDINHGIFIDIFPLDHVPDDENVKKKWLKKIDLLYKTLKVGTAERSASYRGLSKGIKYRLYRMAVKTAGYGRLVRYYEHVCRKYNDRPTERISYIAYSRGKEKHLWKRECFDSSHNVPFEFMEINIPDGYDSRLTVEYHDYMKIVRSSTAHGTMVLEPDVPYEKFLKEHSSQEIMNMMQGDGTEA